MSQRNPMNERYTTDKPQGKTRKSAASAKPANKAASSVRMASDIKPKKQGFLSGLFGGNSSNSATAKEGEKKAEEQSEKRAAEKETEKNDRKAERKRRRAISSFVPDTEEFKRINRKRIILSAIGFGGMIIAIILSLLLPDLPMVSIALMIISWLFFYAGVRIDTTQLRPLREQGYERAMRQQKKGK